MNFWIKTKENFLSGKWVEQTCLALVFFNCASLLAPYHWGFDLLVNFKPQYLVGSVILLLLSVVYRRKWFALCMGILACALFMEIQYSYTTPFAKPPAVQPNFTVVQYNKFYFNDDYARIGEWILTNNFDVILINESLNDTIEAMKQFKDAYPYQFPYQLNERFDDISIISRHPIHVTMLPMKLDDQVFAGTKVLVEKPDLEPVTIYAYHANVPIAGTGAAYRAFQMESMAQLAAEETEKNVILMGDWNLTPYSPLFRKVLKDSGLIYQNYGLFPQTTWPSFNYFEFLKIPIDHILFSQDMALADIKKGPSLGADHQSLVARFHVGGNTLPSQ